MPAVPGWEIFWTEFYDNTALLEREIRAANAAAQAQGTTGPDGTGAALLEDAVATFNTLVANAPRCSEDAAAARHTLLGTAAIMALDRMLTHPDGFRLETVGETVQHLRLHAGRGADSVEGFDLNLPDATGLAAVSGRVSVVAP